METCLIPLTSLSKHGWSSAVLCFHFRNDNVPVPDEAMTWSTTDTICGRRHCPLATSVCPAWAACQATLATCQSLSAQQLVILQVGPWAPLIVSSSKCFVEVLYGRAVLSPCRLNRGWVPHSARCLITGASGNILIKDFMWEREKGARGENCPFYIVVTHSLHSSISLPSKWTEPSLPSSSLPSQWSV